MNFNTGRLINKLFGDATVSNYRNCRSIQPLFISQYHSKHKPNSGRKIWMVSDEPEKHELEKQGCAHPTGFSEKALSLQIRPTWKYFNIYA